MDNQIETNLAIKIANLELENARLKAQITVLHNKNNQPEAKKK